MSVCLPRKRSDRRTAWQAERLRRYGISDKSQIEHFHSVAHYWKLSPHLLLAKRLCYGLCSGCTMMKAISVLARKRNASLSDWGKMLFCYCRSPWQIRINEKYSRGTLRCQLKLDLICYNIKCVRCRPPLMPCCPKPVRKARKAIKAHSIVLLI